MGTGRPLISTIYNELPRSNYRVFLASFHTVLLANIAKNMMRGLQCYKSFLYFFQIGSGSSSQEGIGWGLNFP
jgi:hypothetical protein